MAAVRMLTASSLLSTSATKWVTSTNYNFFSTGSEIYSDDCNTTRNATAFAGVNGRVYTGVFLYLRRSTNLTGTFTIKLMEGSTERATTASLNVDATNLPYSESMVYFAFSTPYTAGSTANLNVRVNCDTAARLYWRRSSTASDWLWAVMDDSDSTTKLASGDTAILKQGVTLTVDENINLGPLDGACMVMGEDSTFYVPNPASQLTVTIGNGAILWSGCKMTFKIGESAENPISVISNAPGVILNYATLPPTCSRVQ
jgi:hypothetical protein